MTSVEPLPENPASRLTVTLRDTREGLGRIVSTLRSVPVSELTYRVSEDTRATAEIVLAPADAPRARRRLHRMVDVLAVTEATTRTP
ncbi:hypothetical protein H9Y04_29055 [Streptomyces sp. TRM66268-LWL]|uniref:ACT domain-containing protein n=1 Tax=Streptomyces polyasparticus TaxID=2767826 RepID=A0ABR7SQI0_9ACTN|nr:hypothetical protein [Streptomyces polyasparticus]MBC9716588.1 hypothetical protein [Streptomyces polyasparticus]